VTWLNLKACVVPRLLQRLLLLTMQ